MNGIYQKSASFLKYSKITILGIFSNISYALWRKQLLRLGQLGFKVKKTSFYLFFTSHYLSLFIRCCWWGTVTWGSRRSSRGWRMVPSTLLIVLRPVQVRGSNKAVLSISFWCESRSDLRSKKILFSPFFLSIL